MIIQNNKNNIILNTAAGNHNWKVAGNNASYFNNAKIVFEVFIIPTCAAGLPCLTSTAMTFYSDHLARELEKITIYRWDPNFLDPYNGMPWPSAESLGLSYTSDYYLNNLVGDIQGVIQMADFVYVEANRASSCDMANVDCGGWHRERVDYGLWMLGWYMNDASGNLWGVAWELEQQGADGNLVAKVREMAQVSSDSGWEYQQ